MLARWATDELGAGASGVEIMEARGTGMRASEPCSQRRPGRGRQGPSVGEQTAGRAEELHALLEALLTAIGNLEGVHAPACLGIAFEAIERLEQGAVIALSLDDRLDGRLPRVRARHELLELPTEGAQAILEHAEQCDVVARRGVHDLHQVRDDRVLVDPEPDRVHHGPWVVERPQHLGPPRAAIVGGVELSVGGQQEADEHVMSGEQELPVRGALAREPGPLEASAPSIPLAPVEHRDEGADGLPGLAVDSRERPDGEPEVTKRGTKRHRRHWAAYRGGSPRGQDPRSNAAP